MIFDFKKIAKFIAAGKWTEASNHFTKNTAPLQVQLSAAVQNTPFTGVLWKAQSPDLCSFIFNHDLPKERVQFFITRLALALPIIIAFHRSEHFVSGSIFFNLDDSADAKGISFCSNRSDSLLIPDTEFLETEGYGKARNYFQLNSIPWQEKLPLVFWRGSTTGVRSGDSWRTIPRITLCEICQNSNMQQLFDVGVSALAQIPKAELKEVQSSGLMRDYVPIFSSNQYKYQIDIDGNTNAWAGLFLKLLSGSAVLKVASPHGFEQWYYDKLIPWVHFVPVQSDLSDLIEKTQWLQLNDDKAMQIGRRGAELAATLSYDLVIKQSLLKIHDAFLANHCQ
ncbi:hypothetical protein TUM22923_02510 [Polynucleobacter sp. TUM22923]|uniref:glycosyl transferase family 90 n=1 Tax=Polynucleobacter sp. TUM22923 TaxID=3022126 RepID=UPI0025728449|nr:glycosyl transferase family 90 [Polynucleobacter sp. TUM22923]BDX20930.1 hypothetical protein TUM22923_02510 [Polynucleobacter sp. TUM22923]